jgi:microcystin-dependent protein
LANSSARENVTLIDLQMPSHQHPITVFAQNDPAKRAASPSPGNGLASPATFQAFAPNPNAPSAFAPGLIGVAGGSTPHANQQPYLAMNFCIALNGIFPAFN